MHVFSQCLSGNADLRGYHSAQKNMDNHSLGLQGGAIILGSNWRLAMPLQVNKQARKDNNEVFVLAIAANFNQRLSAKADYSIFSQLADISSQSTTTATDINSFTLGASYSYRFNESLKLNVDPLVTTENPKARTSKHNGRNLLGLRAGMSYSFSDEQRLDFNFTYLNATHKADDPSFLNERRKDNQVKYGLKFSQRYPNNVLTDLGIQQTNYTGQGKVAQFYNNSISLQDTQNEMLKGSITGRFVGLDAEGALTFYSFDSGSIDPVTGVGFFDRTGVNTPP